MVAFVLLLFSSVVSVEASSTWSKTYGGTGDDCAYSLVATSDGGYALAGDTQSFGAGGRDFWLVKTDSNGIMQWNKTYGGQGYDRAFSLVATFDGGYALAGYTSSLDNEDFWLVKTDVFGNMQWNKTYGGTGNDEARSLVATPDGGYAIAGWTGSFGAGVVDFWLVKVDSLGDMQWNKTYGGGDSFVSYAFSLVKAPDGGYAILGNMEDATYPDPLDSVLPDVLLVKTDAFGNMQWNKTYGTGRSSYLLPYYSLVVTPDGGYTIAGTSGVHFEGERVLKIDALKTDTLGNTQWNQTYGEIGYGEACSLIATSDGGYAIVGGAGTWDFWFVKTDLNGVMEWNRTYGGTASDVAYSVVEAFDGGYALCGSTTSFGAGGEDFWLVKTDETGVVPEFSSWLIPTLVLVTTLPIFINKKKLLHKS